MGTGRCRRGRARSGWWSGPGPQLRRDSTACSSATTTTFPCSITKTSPFSAASWRSGTTRPAGALFLLPLWHPVLLAEQIGTLASIASGPFIMQCAVGGGEEQFRGLGTTSARPSPAIRGRTRHRAGALPGRDRHRTRRSVGDRPGPDLAGAPRAARGLDRRVVGAGDRPGRSHGRCVPDRPRGHADRSRARSCRPTGTRARATDARPTRIAVRRDVHVAGTDEEAAAVAGPIVERGYRGFDPAAVVVRHTGTGRGRLRRAGRARAAPT